MATEYSMRMEAWIEELKSKVTDLEKEKRELRAVVLAKDKRIQELEASLRKGAELIVEAEQRAKDAVERSES